MDEHSPSPRSFRFSDHVAASGQTPGPDPNKFSFVRSLEEDASRAPSFAERVGQINATHGAAALSATATPGYLAFQDWLHRNLGAASYTYPAVPTVPVISQVPPSLPTFQQPPHQLEPPVPTVPAAKPVVPATPPRPPTEIAPHYDFHVRIYPPGEGEEGWVAQMDDTTGPENSSAGLGRNFVAALLDAAEPLDPEAGKTDISP